MIKQVYRNRKYIKFTYYFFMLLLKLEKKKKKKNGFHEIVIEILMYQTKIFNQI